MYFFERFEQEKALFPTLIEALFPWYANRQQFIYSTGIHLSFSRYISLPTKPASQASLCETARDIAMTMLLLELYGPIELFVPLTLTQTLVNVS
jgi:hypothetical protein